MIRRGKLCSTCLGKCNEIPSTAEPLELECPICSGGGCQHCDDGWFQVQGCPKTFCESIIPSLDLIDLFHKGIPPVGGGSLDQSEWFISAARTLRHDEEAINADGKN